MAACDPTVATLPLGFRRWPPNYAGMPVHRQAQVSLHSAQLTTKSLHSPGVSAVLNLKVSTTADIATAKVEIQDIARVCSAASHRVGNIFFLHFMYLESQ